MFELRTQHSELRVMSIAHILLVSPRFHGWPTQRVSSREENDGRRLPDLGIEAYLGIGVTKMLADPDLRLVLAQ